MKSKMIKHMLKQFLCRNQCIAKIAYRLINYLPFNNHWHISRGNRVLCEGLMSKTKISIKGTGNNIVIHPMARLMHCTIEITGNDNSIEIGQWSSCRDTEFFIQDHSGSISIGNRTGISGNTHLACIEGCSIKIGDDCMFSANITVRTGDSHSILDAETGKRINASKDVHIGDYVWIGNQVCVLKGSVIPAHCIVGTGSIVTKEFKDKYIAIAGNPARILRNNVDWCAERI